MPATWISPSLSFGLFGMQVQHQTSTHAGNILSSYGIPCQLDPCPSVCYLHVLTKEQGKGKWALPKKNIAKALDDYLAKGDCLEDIFSTNPQEVSTLCIYPRTPEQPKNVPIKKRLSITTHAQYVLSCNLGGTSHEQS